MRILRMRECYTACGLQVHCLLTLLHYIYPNSAGMSTDYLTVAQQCQLYVVQWQAIQSYSGGCICTALENRYPDCLIISTRNHCHTVLHACNAVAGRCLLHAATTPIR